MHRALQAGCAALIATLATVPVLAQTPYPTKPVRILTGSPPGAPSDMVARILAQQLGDKLKQSFVVENRPGANNGLAASQAARADADGYTLLVTPDTVVTVNPLLYKKMEFDPRADLVPVARVASFNQMLVCNSALKIANVAQLVTRSREKTLTYASGGLGSPGHLAAAMFLSGAGIAMDHIPYKGPSPALSDVMGGQVDCGFLTTPTVLPNIQAGRLTALAVSSSKPSPMAPNVPTLTQVGLPDIDASFSQYLMTPKGTPDAIVSTLQNSVREALADPAVRERLQALDLTPVEENAAASRTRLTQDTAKWSAVVKRLNIQPE